MSLLFICPNCGMYFSKRKQLQIYCSVACREMAARRHRYQQEGKIKPEGQIVVADADKPDDDLEWANCKLELRIAKLRLALASNRQLAARALAMERQMLAEEAF